MTPKQPVDNLFEASGLAKPLSRRWESRIIFPCLWLFVLITWLWPFEAMAGRIVFDVKTTTEQDGQGIAVHLEIANNGDADALWVCPSLNLGKAEAVLEKRPYIAFEGRTAWRHRFTWEAAGFSTHKGIFPLVIWVRYHDSNMYPFSIPVVRLIRLDVSDEPPALTGEMKVADIGEKGGAVAVSIKNPSPEAWAGTCRMILTEELAVTPPRKAFHLKPGGEALLAFQIENRSALKDSVYTVYGVLEGEAGEHHTAALVEGQAKVAVSAAPADNSSRPIVIGGIVLLVLLFLISAYLEVKSHHETCAVKP